MKKSPEILKKLNTFRINRLLIIFVSLCTLLAGLLYLWAGKRTVESLSEQILHRQQVVARAGSKSIETFLSMVGKSLMVLSDHLSLLPPEEIGGTPSILQKFASDWRNTPFVEIILIDKEGQVIFGATAKEGRLGSGISVSDREYFLWVKSALRNQTYVGKPIVQRGGKFVGRYIAPVATSLFRNGNFEGALVASVLLSELNKEFIDPLKLSEKTRVYFSDSDGYIIYGTSGNLVGKNYLEYLRKKPYKGSELAIQKFSEALSKSEEGKLNLILPDERKGGLDRFLISYSPVRFADTNFVLAIASPVKEALIFLGPFQDHQTTLLVFGIVVIVGFSALMILAVRIAQRESFLKGFVKGRDHKK